MILRLLLFWLCGWLFNESSEPTPNKSKQICSIWIWMNCFQPWIQVMRSGCCTDLIFWTLSRCGLSHMRQTAGDWWSWGGACADQAGGRTRRTSAHTRCLLIVWMYESVKGQGCSACVKWLRCDGPTFGFKAKTLLAVETSGMKLTLPRGLILPTLVSEYHLVQSTTMSYPSIF